MIDFSSKISPDKTLSDMMVLLRKVGAKRIAVEYGDNNDAVIRFQYLVPYAGKTLTFELKANPEGVLEAMEEDRDVAMKYCKPDQAERTSWRILYHWLMAQIALIESKSMSVEQAFFGQIVTSTGKTLHAALMSGEMHPQLLGE